MMHASSNRHRGFTAAARSMPGGVAMHKSQLRWIEGAEARAVREHALLQRAASEPYVGIACTRTGPAWFDRLRDWPLGRTVAALRSLLAGRTTRVGKARPRAALRVVSSEMDDDRVLVTVLI